MDRQNCDSLAPGSLTKYGISTAAFVAAAVKLNAQDPTAAAVAEKLPLDGCRGTSLVKMLASAAAIGRAELRRLLLTPGPADKPMCCKIVRCPGGLLKGKSQYTLMAEEGGLAGTFMAAAFKHKSGPAGTTFLLSVDQHDMLHYRTAGRIAKLRSNCLGTEFVLTGDASPSGSARCELAAALYQANVCGTKGPRKLTVVIPKLEPAGLGPLQLATKGDHALLSRYTSHDLSCCMVLRNKPPRWNQSLAAYCLNFGGRVTHASVKNFQLASVDDMERTILQFGKTADDVFTMDFGYPMTALQAFGICLSSFSSKLANE